MQGCDFRTRGVLERICSQQQLLVSTYRALIHIVEQSDCMNQTPE